MRLREQWDRFQRSVPVFGIAGHLGWRAERLERAREDDAAYRQTMATLGVAAPRFANLGEERERHVMAGELAGFALAAVAGLGIWLARRDALLAWLAAWFLGFVADDLGGRIGGWICDRKHPRPVDEDDGAGEGRDPAANG